MIKFYFKVFSVNFILAATLASMVFRLKSGGEDAGLASAAGIGGIFALFMALVAATLHVIMVKKYAGREPAANPYSPAQELELTISMSYKELFALCLQYVTEKERYALSEADSAKGVITARTPLTWKGYGNIFSINFSEIKDGSAKVRISSRPRMLFVLLDYGDNLMNVLRARDYLNSNAR